MYSTHPRDSSGNVDATKGNLPFHHNMVGKVAYMETNPNSLTSVMASPRD